MHTATLSESILQRYEQATTVLVPKGENRSAVLKLLADHGLIVPEFPGKHLTVDKDGKRFALQRDKDMPQLISSLPQLLGFLGSDTYDERCDTQSDVVFETIAYRGLRMALAAPLSNQGQIATKIEAGEPISIATSYPKAAARCGVALNITRVIGGSVEAQPMIDPAIEGIVDIVDSGQTLRDNGLCIVVDHLAPVTLGAIWNAQT